MITLPSGIQITNRDFVSTFSRRTPSKVIISVPHDGFTSYQFEGLFVERSKGWKGADVHVWPIVRDMLTMSAQKNIPIEVVRLLMPRAFVDGNRELPSAENYDPETAGQTALDDQTLVPVYTRYHGEISRLLTRSIRRFGREHILLIDMHGFGKQPSFAPQGGYDLILGTANKRTVPFGSMDEQFAEYMVPKGYTVFVPQLIPVRPSGDPYSAGHTTRYYAQKYGINAIQIEIASRFRALTGKEQGVALASDLIGFLASKYK